MARSFDVAETQILVSFPTDPYPWHRRILFDQLQGAVWLSYSPDVDGGPQELDLNHENWDLVVRNSLLSPAHVAAGVYWFDPLTVAELRQMRQEARNRARLLGGAVGTTGTQLYWYYSDTGIERFGEPVDDAVVQGRDFAELNGHALVSDQGTVCHVELVAESDLDKWKEDTKKTDVDDRLLHIEYEGELPAGHRRARER